MVLFLREQLKQACGDPAPTGGVLIFLAALIWALTSVAASFVTSSREMASLAWQLFQVPFLLAVVVGFRLRQPFMSEDDLRRTITILFLSVAGHLLMVGALWLTHFEPSSPTAEKQLADALSHGVPAVIPLLGAILMAPVVEELFFRGVLLRGVLLGGGSLPTAMALQALVFALAHGDLVLLPHFMVAGLGLGLISLTRWGLGGAMFVHALVNGFNHLQAVL